MSIYQSLPEGSTQDVRKDRSHILKLLKENPDITFKSNEIAKRLGYPTKGSCPEVRKDITHLIEEDLQPIISGAKGYKYTTNKDEIHEYMDSLRHRAQGIERRITALGAICNRNRSWF